MASEATTIPTETGLGGGVVLRIPGKSDTYTTEEFWELCQLNPDLQLEKNSDGSVVIMTPTGGNTGRRNSRITQALANWNDQTGTGVVFDSSTMFQFPNQSVKSPDASWVLLSQWNRLSKEAQDGLPPIVPDFVVELASPSDHLRRLREKMREYTEAGVRLGWLIDPKTRSVEVYRPGKEVERIENAATVSGDPELPGLVMDLAKVW